MSQAFDRDCFCGRLVRGDLRTAMDYLGGFPEQAELYQKYRSLFQEERYLTYDVDADLHEILLIYQKYYRDAFYLELPDAANAANGHGLAAARIAEGFRRHRRGDLAGLSVGEVQAIAQALFTESSENMAEKYPGHGKERNAYVIR